MRVKVLIALVAVLVVISGCATQGPPPWRPDQQVWWPPDDPTQSQVDWGSYRPNLKADVDSAGDTSNCARLYELFNEAASTETNDRLALTYIDAWGGHLNCAEFADDPQEYSDDEWAADEATAKAGGPCKIYGNMHRFEDGTVLQCIRKRGSKGKFVWVKS